MLAFFFKAFEEPLFKARVRFQTLRNLYAIRRAYGVALWGIPKRAAGIGLAVFFLLFGAIVAGRFTNWNASFASASVARPDLQMPARKVPAAAEPDLPANLVPYAFLVDKSRKSMTVYHPSGSRWIVKEEFTIILGESPGRKQSEGDKRTPEGLYWIIGQRAASELDTVIYGSRAYILNYPNRFDRREGRGGSGIWIHGTDRPVSRGCVAMKKPDLDRIAAYARSGIPVYIASQTGGNDFGHFVPGEVLLAEKDSAMQSIERVRENACEFVRDWSRAWQSANIEDYRKYYSPQRFQSKGMGYDDYMRYKEGLFQNLGTGLRVEVRDMTAELYDSTRIDVRFQQIYQAAGLSSISDKTLELIRGADGFQIIGEHVTTNNRGGV